MFAVLVVEFNEALSCRLAAVANGRFERTNGSERESCKEDYNSRKDKKKNLYIYTKSSCFFFFFVFFVKILAVEFLTMVAIRLGGLAWDQGAPLALSFFFGEELRETRRMVP